MRILAKQSRTREVRDVRNFYTCSRYLGHLGAPVLALTERGLLNGEDARRARQEAAVPIVFVALVGVTRSIAGIFGGKPVLWLFVILVVVGIALALALHTPRRTTAGSAEQAVALRKFSHLRPSNRPAMGTYSDGDVGTSVALYGGAAM